MKISNIVLASCLLAVLPTPLLAKFDPVARGIEIAQKADAVDTGWVNQKVDIKMTLEDKSGNKNVRIVRSETLEVHTDGDKGLIIFDTPRDIQGTVLLSFSHKVGDDDQWLYLPSLKRVKRISSSNKSGPFMGSDFAYEDMSSQEVEKYTYRFIEDAKYKQRDALVVERIPVYKKSGYSKQLVWVDAERFIPLKTEYFDRKGSLMKTQDYQGYQLYKDKFWRADALVMVNHQKGTQTTIELDNYQLDTDVNPANFRQLALKRIR